MKNTITGRLAAAMFVALIFLFSLQIVSCGGGGAQTGTSSGTDSKGSSGSSAILTCVDINCTTVTLPVKYDSTRGPGPKLKIYEGTTDSTIPAGTRLRLVVPMTTDSVSH